jgi:hypothetical protein
MIDFQLCQWRKRSPECFGGDHDFVDVVALWAFKRAEVEAYSCGHDAREHHDTTALWASWTMDVSVYIIRQEIGFLHNASLKGGGSTTLSVTGRMPVK